MLRLSVCRHDNDYTVWVHSDRLAHGNGWGCKGHDFHGCFGCDRCHALYASKEFTDEERAEFFQKAHDESWRWLLENRRIQFVKRRA